MTDPRYDRPALPQTDPPLANGKHDGTLLPALPNAQVLNLPLLPINTVIVYPETVKPLNISDPTLQQSADYAFNHQQEAVLFGVRDLDLPFHAGNFQQIGTLVTLRRISDDAHHVLAQGRARVEFIELTQTEPCLMARVQLLPESYDPSAAVKAAMRAALIVFRRLMGFHPEVPTELFAHMRETEHPGHLADLIGSSAVFELHERQTLLEMLDPIERLHWVNGLLGKAVAMHDLEAEIEARVDQQLEQDQRQSYLREQMRVIQAELGEADVHQREIEEQRQRVAQAQLPPEAHTRVLKEISRLALVSPMAPEIGLIHTYIDWIVSLPWSKSSTDNLDIAHAKRVLDENHYGLERIKDRVLEHIAVRKLAAEQMKTPILCFLGPPGVGKTSLGKSIAQALGREFVRVSLGGVRDEAEIRGHRRTYVGSMPGRILQTLRRAGTRNPVMMLDEIDKLSSDLHGDPAAALLEVLDPEQNQEFFDHYLDLPFDLSQVMFITTANDLYPLPPALEDRLEIIEFPSYIEEEKRMIARRFLIPRQLEAHGLPANSVEFENATLTRMIREYTYEAGVRSLDRRIAEVLRKYARLLAESKPYPPRVKPKTLDKLLGVPDYIPPRPNNEDQIGVITGLAWTSVGGDVMTIEAALLPGKGNLTLTGQLGDVMQESAQTAYSYMRSQAERFDVDDDDFEDYDLHIHLPEGGIPKEGPSAGVTLAIAMISVYTERVIRSDYALTGEITLRGRILPVGGVREKLMAAHRAGISRLILPETNRRDLSEVPQSVMKNLDITFVSDIQQVIDLILLPAPEERVRDQRALEDAESEADNER